MIVDDYLGVTIPQAVLAARNNGATDIEFEDVVTIPQAVLAARNEIIQ